MRTGFVASCAACQPRLVILSQESVLLMGVAPLVCATLGSSECAEHGVSCARFSADQWSRFWGILWGPGVVNGFPVGMDPGGGEAGNGLRRDPHGPRWGPHELSGNGLLDYVCTY